MAERSGWARRSRAATSTSRVIRSTPTRASGTRSPAATTRWSSASARSRRALMSRGSTSRAATSSARSARYRAANAIACTWTLRALEDALLEFAGSILVISHDRWFLDRIATHILAAEGDSKWVFFNGNYQEYEADKRRRLGEEGAKPRRLRFKPIR